MKVFISWSKEPSHTVAKLLRDWLPSVLNDRVETWVSSEDIGKGRRSIPEIAGQLESTDFGIVCRLPNNLLEPWLNFEAGALSKSVSTSHVAPFLVGVKIDEIDGPLGQFQFTSFSKEDVRKLVTDVNSCLDSPVESASLARNFDNCWPRLEIGIGAIEIPAYVGSEEAADRFNADDRSDEQIRVLTLLSADPEDEMTSPQVAAALHLHRTREKYLLDELEDDDFVDVAMDSTTDEDIYTLSRKGRAYVARNGIV